jgi:hypothetical protein
MRHRWNVIASATGTRRTRNGFPCNPGHARLLKPGSNIPRRQFTVNPIVSTQRIAEFIHESQVDDAKSSTFVHGLLLLGAVAFWGFVFAFGLTSFRVIVALMTLQTAKASSKWW